MGGSEGLWQKKVLYSHWVGRIRSVLLRNPSVKNQRFLPAPFAQGSLGALRPLQNHLSNSIKICYTNRNSGAVFLIGYQCIMITQRTGDDYGK